MESVDFFFQIPFYFFLNSVVSVLISISLKRTPFEWSTNVILFIKKHVNFIQIMKLIQFNINLLKV